MLKSRFLAFASTFAVLCSLFFLTCVLPEDPADLSNAQITSVFKNVQGTLFETTLVDTLGKKIAIGVAVHLPEHFDSVKIVIISDALPVDSITFTRFHKEMMDDTLWTSYTFLTSGVKNIQVTPYLAKGSLNPVTASILMVNSTTILPKTNHDPVLTYSGNTSIKSGETCQLTIVASDEDSGQNVTISLVEPVEGASLTGTSFTWAAPAAFAGVKTVKIKATDNGSPSKDTTIEVSITVTSTALPPTYTVTYNANTGSGTVPVDSNVYKKGAMVAVVTAGSIKKTDSEFTGWNTSSDGKGTARTPGTAFEMDTADVTLYAIWTPVAAKATYVLTVAATNGMVSRDPDLATYDSGTVVKLTPVPAANYHFAGWSGALSGTTNPATVTMNGTISVTAEFAKNQANSFTLTVLATNGTVKKAPDLPQYDSGSAVGLKATPAPGYSFVNWSGDAAGTTDSTTVTMSAAKSVTANFVSVTYQLTVNAGSEGTISAPSAPATVNHGTATIITSSPNSGYKFSGWSVTTGTATIEDASALSTSVTLTSGNATVVASFTRITYQLTVTTDAGGTISTPTSPATVNYGVATTVTATPIAGYSFNGWVVTSGSAAIPDLLSATTTATLTTGNAEIRAQWTAIPYSITYALNGGQQAGGIYPATYSVNTTAITLPSPTKTAYVFDGWYDNSGLSGSELTSIPTGSTGDKALFAKWAIKDRDGNYYSEVKIGNQYWMLENFRCTKYNDGTPIEHVSDYDRWYSLNDEAYCYYDNSESASEQQKWGALYNWFAVNTGKLAPAGWHVPTDAEWTVLENYLIANGFNYDGSKNDNKIAKSMATKTDWKDTTITGAIGNDLTKNNSSGFSALPGGCRGHYYGNFFGKSNTGYWWSATERDAPSSYAYSRDLHFDYSHLENIGIDDKRWGFSVRLVRD